LVSISSNPRRGSARGDVPWNSHSKVGSGVNRDNVSESILGDKQTDKQEFLMIGEEEKRNNARKGIARTVFPGMTRMSPVPTARQMPAGPASSDGINV
jgi:hypothetical protein